MKTFVIIGKVIMELSSHYNFFNHTLILYVERLNYNFTWQMRLLGQGGVCEGHVGQPQSERRVWAGEHLSVTVFLCVFFFPIILVLESCRGHVLTVCVSGDY